HGPSRRRGPEPYKPQLQRFCSVRPVEKEREVAGGVSPSCTKKTNPPLSIQGFTVTPVLQRDTEPPMIEAVDLFIIGGGINGAGIARDAVGRGLSVFLAEQGDYGCATSSASSKLIHGGLRYLEQREFRLVRESLRERDVMLRLAPHL